MHSRFFAIVAAVILVLVSGLFYTCVASEPQVTLLSPSLGDTVSGKNVEVAIGYNTGSGDQVTHIELYLNNAKQDVRKFDEPRSRGIVSFVMDSTKTPNGSHVISAKVFAGSKLIASVSRAAVMANVPSDTTAPSIRFAQLQAGDVLSGSQLIALEVKDDSGAAPIVSILVDKTVKGIKNQPPYEFALNTEDLADGNYEIEAVAVDAAGNQSSAAPVLVAIGNMVAPVYVAAAPAEAVEQEYEDQIIVAASSTAQVFDSDVVTTVDTRTGVPVESEPIVPLASPSFVDAVGRSSVFDISPSSGYRSISGSDQGNSVRLIGATPVARTAPVESLPPQNDVSVAAAPEPLSIDVTEIEVSAPAAAVGVPSEIVPVKETPVLQAPIGVGHPADTPGEEPVFIAAMPRQIAEDNSVAYVPTAVAPTEMMALRDVLERKGLKVEWLANGGVVTAANANTSIEFQVGAVEVLINDRVVVLSSPIEFRDGRVMGPATLLEELAIPEPEEAEEGDNPPTTA